MYSLTSWARDRRFELLVAGAGTASCLILGLALLARDHYSLIYYADALSHLVISRRIIDWIDPGFTQIGSVWLPMTHVMLIPFVSVDSLFRTGLAGTIVSGACTGIASAALFKLASAHFNSTKAGLLAAGLFLANPSVLYMGAVPMMEAPFMMFFMLAAYYFQQWYLSGGVWKQYRNILKCALAVSGATLTRYEGWILPLALFFVAIVAVAAIQREPWRPRKEAFVSVAVSYSSIGIVGWLLWNFTIFRDPLYFANAPFYAAEQAALTRPFRDHLFLHPLNSLSIMLGAARDMYGLPVLLLAGLGLVAYVYAARKKGQSHQLLLLAMLVAPLAATYLALVQGSGEIYPLAHGYFNGRYLTFAAPFVALGATALVMLAVKARTKVVPLLMLVLLVGAYSANFGSQSFDPSSTVAMSGDVLPFNPQYQANLQTGAQVGSLVTHGRVVVFAAAQEGEEIMFASNLPLKVFIDVNAGPYWNVSRLYPWVYGSYLVLAKTPQADDTQLLAYWSTNSALISQHFKLVYEDDSFKLFANTNGTSTLA